MRVLKLKEEEPHQEVEEVENLEASKESSEEGFPSQCIHITRVGEWSSWNRKVRIVMNTIPWAICMCPSSLG